MNDKERIANGETFEIEKEILKKEKLKPRINYPSSFVYGQYFEDIRKDLQDTFLEEAALVPFENLLKFKYCDELFGAGSLD